MLLFQSDREFIVFTSAFIEIAVTLDVGRYNDSSSTLIIIYAVPYYCFSVIEHDSIHQTLRTTVCTNSPKVFTRLGERVFVCVILRYQVA